MGIPIWRASSPVTAKSDSLKRIEPRFHVNTHRRNRNTATAQPLGSLQRYLSNSADPSVSLHSSNDHDGEQSSSSSSPPSVDASPNLQPSSSSLLEILQSQSLAIMGRQSGNVSSGGTRGYDWWRSRRADLESRLDPNEGLIDGSPRTQLHTRSSADEALDIPTQFVSSPEQDLYGTDDFPEPMTYGDISHRNRPRPLTDFDDGIESASSSSSNRVYASDIPWSEDDSAREPSSRRSLTFSIYDGHRINRHTFPAPVYDDLASRRAFRRRRLHPSVRRDQNGNFQGTTTDTAEAAPLRRSLRATPTVYGEWSGAQFSTHDSTFDGLGDRNRSPSPGAVAPDLVIDARSLGETIASPNASIACEPGDDFSAADSLDLVDLRAPH